MLIFVTKLRLNGDAYDRARSLRNAWRVTDLGFAA
jgi:hypothetical protein